VIVYGSGGRLFGATRKQFCLASIERLPMIRLRHLLIAAIFGTVVSSFGRDITAKSAIAIDAASGKVLWTRDADASMFPASTTKIMTGLLLVEHCLPTDVITAPADIEKVKEASMHLKPGERVTAHDMLYALMLRSANDGSYAVAVHISGSVEAFAKLMNQRAKELGCTHTHFCNPNGLNNREHTTTAHDLALIARAAMRYQPFRDAVKTVKYEISRSINLHDRVMVNHDKLLKKDPLAEGIKTGYTVPAGHCFVGSSTRNGFRVIAVVLKSQHWQKDNEDLMAWSFHHFERKEKLNAGEIVGAVRVPGSGPKPVSVALAEAAYTLGPVGENSPRATEEIELLPKVQAPVKKGQRIGDLVLRDADGWTQKVPVVAHEDVEPAMLAQTVKKASTGSTLFIGSLVFVGSCLVRGRMKRKLKYYARPTKGKGA
jgi:D-alanyl-D-alanine carboxypeptidase (penicillin-binding protein 5/6)